MSANKFLSSKRILQGLGPSSSIHRYVRKPSACPVRAIRTSRSLAEEERSFRGQLYESTQKRLEKEREEQRRFARERGEAGGGRNAAILFSVPPNIHYIYKRQLIDDSGYWFFDNVLLSWNIEACRGVAILNITPLVYRGSPA